MTVQSELLKELMQLTGNSTLGPLFALTTYFVTTRAIPWIWDKVSADRKATRSKEISERTAARKDITEVKNRLILLNGHTKNEDLHMTKEDLYNTFLSIGTYSDKHGSVEKAIETVQKQNNTIIEAVLKLSPEGN